MVTCSDAAELRAAALVVERPGWAADPEVGEFMAFVLRTAAHGRDPEDLVYRMAQLARAINGVSLVEHDSRCDRDCCVPDCRVALRRGGVL